MADEPLNIAEIAAAPNIPHLYCNGFANALSNSDILLILHQNNNIIGTVNLSFTIAKTLSEKLGKIVEELETKTNRKMLTTDDVGLMMSGSDKSDGD